MYKIFGNYNPEKYEEKIIVKNQKNLYENIVLSFNFHLQIIPFILNQEYQIIKLQNYEKQKEPNNFLYELLYQGLQEKFLDYFDTKPLIEAFYQTNRITENQYKTLTLHLYLEDREYEEPCNNS